MSAFHGRTLKIGFLRLKETVENHWGWLKTLSFGNRMTWLPRPQCFPSVYCMPTTAGHCDTKQSSRDTTHTGLLLHECMKQENPSPPQSSRRASKNKSHSSGDLKDKMNSLGGGGVGEFEGGSSRQKECAKALRWDGEGNVGGMRRKVCLVPNREG